MSADMKDSWDESFSTKGSVMEEQRSAALLEHLGEVADPRID
jgi:hypothetical protein